MADNTERNNKANVSTTRGLVGGYFYSAAVTNVDVPTKANYASWTPSDAWELQGYIPSDGMTETVSTDGGTDLQDINLDVVDSVTGSSTETIQVGFMEIAHHALATVYGHANVTDENGTIEVAHNWTASEEERMYVFLLVLKNGRKWVKFIPSAKVTERGDLTLNKTTIAQRTVTLTYLTDEDGNGCFDWIDSNDTPKPVLTALSLTGGTLSPTFDAATRAYTATASGSSVTVTATAAAGNTVSIKCGENTYSSGSSIPVVTGTNKIVVTVTNTDSGAIGAYTLTITKS